MHIDWFTFVAQIINFLILVALLRWLLYRPIVRAVEQREQRIARRLEQAEQKQIEAEQYVQEYEEKSRQIDQQRQDLLQQARQQAHEEHQRFLQEARQDVDRKREQWRQAYRREQDDFLLDLRRQAGEMGLHAARRTLAELADAELEHRICDTFASRLQQLDEEQRQRILHHAGDGDLEVAVRSAFDVSRDQRERLCVIIRETFDADAEVSFERSADLICGLELDVGGYTFGWNVKDFLRDLDLEFAEHLSRQQ